MLDRDLAAVYRVRTKHLNQQVKRNLNRFPDDFMFQLTGAEAERICTLGSRGSWHGKRPHAFTEQGAGMLATVLRSPVAAQVTIHILRVFKSLRAAEEPEPWSQVESKRLRLFHAVRDALLLCPQDMPFTTEERCTYFLQAGRNGPIKIGSTKNLVVRLRTLATMVPIPLKLLGIMKGDHEEYCHMRLGAFRTHGEWFTPADAVLEFIRANATVLPPGDNSR